MAGLNRKINFHGAALRHHSDAVFLQSDGRNANAGHLYGFVAECGLKAILVAGGLQTKPDGDIEVRDFRLHVDRLANQINMIHSFLDGRTMAGYLAHIPDIANFCNWDTSHRYYDESQIPAALDKWGAAASQVMKMLDMAKSDGKI